VEDGVMTKAKRVTLYIHVAARATPLDNVIDVSIARLRRKIDDPFPVKLLHTVRGVGFVLRRERG